MKEFFTVIDLPTFQDSRGCLTVLEDFLPFTVRRIFWITDADNQTRGGHRHKKNRQALVSIMGSVQVYLNNGLQEKNINLKSPSQCLLVEPEDWHTMSFGVGAILMVLSSQTYDVSDYIDEPYAKIHD